MFSSLILSKSVSGYLAVALSSEKVSFVGTKIMVNASYYLGLAFVVIVVALAVTLRLTTVKHLTNIPNRTQYHLESFVKRSDKIAKSKFFKFLGKIAIVALICISLNLIFELVGLKPVFANFYANIVSKLKGVGMNSNLFQTEGVSEHLAEALSPEKVSFFGSKIMVNPSYYSGFAVMLILVVLAIILRCTVIKNMKNTPNKIQMVLESLVKTFSSMADGKYNSSVGCYIMVAAIYICLGTLIELFGFRPIFADLNACVSMGVSTFILIFFFGIKEKKGRRFLHYINPINILTDIAVPVSMSFRLFGSIVSGLLIIELIYSYLILSFGVPVLVSVITTLFHALIQSYIFAVLSSLFIGEATE